MLQVGQVIINNQTKISYKIQGLLGQGSGGQVYKALNQLNNQQVALKVQHYMTENEKLALKTISFIKFEHILNIYEYWPEPPYHIIIMEKGDGSFYEYLQQNKNLIQKDQINKLFFQIVFGIKELHDRQLMHRDIKPENIIYQKQNDGNIILKIIDTGLMKTIRQVDQTQSVGTVYYMAPEQINSQIYDQRIDIWALGMNWYEMLNNLNPMVNGQSIQEVMNNILNNNQMWFNQKVEQLDIDDLEIKETIKNMLIWDKNQRTITCEEILTLLDRKYLLNIKNKQEKLVQLPQKIFNPIIQYQKQLQLEQQWKIQLQTKLQEEQSKMKKDYQYQVKIKEDEYQQQYQQKMNEFIQNQKEQMEIKLQNVKEQFENQNQEEIQELRMQLQQNQINEQNFQQNVDKIIQNNEEKIKEEKEKLKNEYQMNLIQNKQQMEFEQEKKNEIMKQELEVQYMKCLDQIQKENEIKLKELQEQNEANKMENEQQRKQDKIDVLNNNFSLIIIYLQNIEKQANEKQTQITLLKYEQNLNEIESTIQTLRNHCILQTQEIQQIQNNINNLDEQSLNQILKDQDKYQILLNDFNDQLNLIQKQAEQFQAQSFQIEYQILEYQKEFENNNSYIFSKLENLQQNINNLYSKILYYNDQQIKNELNKLDQEFNLKKQHQINLQLQISNSKQYPQENQQLIYQTNLEEIKNLRKEIEKLITQSEKLKNKFSELKTIQLTNLNTDLNNLQLQIKELQNKINTNNHQLESNEINKLRQDLITDLNNQDQQIQQFQTQLNQDIAEQFLIIYQKQIQEYQKQLQKIQQNHQFYIEKLNIFDQEKRNLQQKKHLAEQQLDQFKIKQREELQTQLINIDELIEEVQQLDQQTHQYFQRQSQLYKYQAMKIKIEQLNKLKNKSINLIKKIENLQIEIKNNMIDNYQQIYEHKINKIKKEYSEIKEVINQLKVTFQEVYFKSINRQQAEFQQYNNQLQSIIFKQKNDKDKLVDLLKSISQLQEFQESEFLKKYTQKYQYIMNKQTEILKNQEQLIKFENRIKGYQSESIQIQFVKLKQKVNFKENILKEQRKLLQQINLDQLLNKTQQLNQGKTKYYNEIINILQVIQNSEQANNQQVINNIQQQINNLKNLNLPEKVKQYDQFLNDYVNQKQILLQLKIGYILTLIIEIEGIINRLPQDKREEAKEQYESYIQKNRIKYELEARNSKNYSQQLEKDSQNEVINIELIFTSVNELQEKLQQIKCQDFFQVSQQIINNNYYNQCYLLCENELKKFNQKF